METCKYCGGTSHGWCCPSCWDLFERGRPCEDEDCEYDDEDYYEEDIDG